MDKNPRGILYFALALIVIGFGSLSAVTIATFYGAITRYLSLASGKIIIAITGSAVGLLGIVVMSNRAARVRKFGQLKTISWRWVVAGVFIAALSAWLVTSWLLSIAGDDPGRKLDAIKTGLTVGAGAGGIIALLIATRRQWLQERTHIHEREIAQLTQYDATERRVTELYASAAGQLGNEKAAVRLAGLYALERLAQNHEEYRQTIVSVLCAYLRMRFPESAPAANPNSWEEEEQVRLTAQDILTRHLRYDQDEASPDFWPEISIFLNGAHLIDFRLDGAKIATASFVNATFKGECRFSGTVFAGPVTFRGAAFSGVTSFSKCRFESTASFGESRFQDVAAFRDVTFMERATFTGASFARSVTFSSSDFKKLAKFTSATFANSARFSGSVFYGITDFEDASFEAEAIFSAAEFYGVANFLECIFLAGAKFRGATFHGRTVFTRAQFGGRATYEGCTFVGIALFGGGIFEGQASFRASKFLAVAAFGGVQFMVAARYENAYFDEANFAGATFSARAGFGNATFIGKGNFRSVNFLGLIKFSGNAQAADVDFTDASSSGVRIGDCILPSGWQIAENGVHRSFVHVSSMQP
ncbi:pentapeptide repeat-containing protein [Actinomadura geliboluensis]|uniref:Pentapeptide repeat-containing protein n=1 Tax=Actinomadura geliboluensis TaxID=882440 RepID=A0A5S4GNR4_9ACTN|nr:pentapeptide repeat-containing protein [Actinomadura geliboluensis]TMR34586.1 pentapeptide repeat-containing protein [Actinomadura geliboluensis]